MMFNRVLKLRTLFVALFECVRMMCNSYRGIEASELTSIQVCQNSMLMGRGLESNHSED